MNFGIFLYNIKSFNIFNEFNSIKTSRLNALPSPRSQLNLLSLGIQFNSILKSRLLIYKPVPRCPAESIDMPTVFYQQRIQQPTFVSVTLFSTFNPSTLHLNSKPLFSTPITLSTMKLFTPTTALLLAA